MDQATLSRLIAAYPFESLPNDEHGRPQFLTCPVRIAFAYLREPRPGQNGGKPKYACSMIVPPGVDASIASRAVASVADVHQGFKDNWRNLVGSGGYFLPIKPQAKPAAKYPGFVSTPGAVYFDASTQFQPDICRYDASGAKIKMTYAEGAGFYSGIWARVYLSAYSYGPTAQNRQAKAGIGFNLLALQKLADDEEFKGGDRTDVFGVVAHAPVPAAASPLVPAAGAVPIQHAVPAVAQPYAPPPAAAAPAASAFNLPGLG